jgi:hypothetical protein
MAVELPQ